MDSFLQMNIFFYVTTIAVVVLSTLAGIVLWRLARVMKQIDRISMHVASESEALKEDVARIRSALWRGESRIRTVVRFLKKTIRSKTNEYTS